MTDKGAYGKWIVGVGRIFLGFPYLAGTLEARGRERLIANWSAFDCVTFVETVLALGACAWDGPVNKTRFRKHLQYLRYRGGAIDGFSSRLHYFNDWISDNEKKGVVSDVCRSLGADPLRKKISFMTDHRELYPSLKNETEFQKMLAVEKRLSRRVFRILDPARSWRRTDGILSGDIVAFVTNEKGLDIAHVGFALSEGPALRLLHASSREGKVEISQKTLAAYLRASKTFSGVRVVRPRPPFAWRGHGFSK